MNNKNKDSIYKFKAEILDDYLNITVYEKSKMTVWTFTQKEVSDIVKNYDSVMINRIGQDYRADIENLTSIPMSKIACCIHTIFIEELAECAKDVLSFCETITFRKKVIPCRNNAN